MSSRAIDKLIRKYGEEAGIQSKVNAQTLRNTFAVRLVSNETSIEDASRLLGITSPGALRRYKKAAQKEKRGNVSREELEKHDNLPMIVQRTITIPNYPGTFNVLEQKGDNLYVHYVSQEMIEEVEK